ncbi:unnamed protein product [Heligmosomoides polygyrus]|uniref:Golgin-84 n=1 Tax=Heligmosomoides polygyrus TaxID=6339 RepID=A0A3P8CSB7_HELPZ|nr:unnamed protein product [Heligmosomoides polygyrus]
MSWLRNLQGQLSEFANEVLSEATDEVADPESELQVSLCCSLRVFVLQRSSIILQIIVVIIKVANKKRSEAERLLVIEQSKVSRLEEKVLEQEHLLSALQGEIDLITERHRTMVLTRDEEIKKLQVRGPSFCHAKNTRDGLEYLGIISIPILRILLSSVLVIMTHSGVLRPTRGMTGNKKRDTVAKTKVDTTSLQVRDLPKSSISLIIR